MQLERRWAAKEQARLARLQALLSRHASLLATMHYSRHLAARCGLNPWRALVQRRREQAAAADALHARYLLQRALAAWQRLQQAVAWRAVGKEACALAAPRRLRHASLQLRALTALRQHAHWCRRSLPLLHASHLRSMALRSWRSQAQAAAQRTREGLAAAAAHADASLCRSAVGAWQQGARRLRTERLVAQRTEQRWGEVQRYLAEAKQRQERERAAQAAKDGADGGRGGARGADENSSLWDANALFLH